MADPAPVDAWLSELYSLIDDGENDRAIDLVFDTFDELGQRDDQARMAAIMSGADVSRLTLGCIVALAEIGAHQRVESVAWSRFMEAAQPRLKEMDRLVRLQ